MAGLPDWIYRQSAVLPWRRRGRALEVLLITSRKGKRWVLPKGIVEPGLTAPGSALKEAVEEAGIEGDVARIRMGRYVYGKWGGFCEVEVFPMRVTGERDEWPESEVRRRKWMPIEIALKKIKAGKLRKILRRLPAVMETLAAADWIAFTAATRRQHVIYLLRHAKSSWDDTGLADFDRPLAPRGQRAGKLLRDYLRFAEVEPDVVLCSSALRTRQTLDAVLPAIGARAKVKYDRGLYERGAQAATNRLRRLPEELTTAMLIGHNPALQCLALGLAGSGDPVALERLEIKFPTAALATLVVTPERWRELAPGSCELHSLVVPRELE